MRISTSTWSTMARMWAPGWRLVRQDVRSHHLDESNYLLLRDPGVGMRFLKGAFECDLRDVLLAFYGGDPLVKGRVRGGSESGSRRQAHRRVRGHFGDKEEIAAIKLFLAHAAKPAAPFLRRRESWIRHRLMAGHQLDKGRSSSSLTSYRGGRISHRSCCPLNDSLRGSGTPLIGAGCVFVRAPTPNFCHRT